MNQEPSFFPKIGAVVMAAGLSKRMGTPKMLLAWGEDTVISNVASTLLSAKISDVAVVTGAIIDEIKSALSNQSVSIVFNPDYADGIMLNSMKVGLKALNSNLDAALIALGDNPQIEKRVVNEIIEEYKNTRSRIIVPSYKMRRGHPWLVDRSLWEILIQWDIRQTLRDFLNQYAQEIHYLNVNSPSVIMDLDTPEDYESQKPGTPE